MRVEQCDELNAEVIHTSIYSYTLIIEVDTGDRLLLPVLASLLLKG